jgi:hypothetical protein
MGIMHFTQGREYNDLFPVEVLAMDAFGKWWHYYWHICKEFGSECYRTWRWELLASIVVVICTAVISGQWKELRTATFATLMTLGCFAVWHLFRVPWIVHQAISGRRKGAEPGLPSGIFGLFVVVGLFVGGYVLARELWRAKPVAIIDSVFCTADPGARGQVIAQQAVELQDKDEKISQLKKSGMPASRGSSASQQLPRPVSDPCNGKAWVGLNFGTMVGGSIDQLHMTNPPDCATAIKVGHGQAPRIGTVEMKNDTQVDKTAPAPSKQP